MSFLTIVSISWKNSQYNKWGKHFHHKYIYYFHMVLCVQCVQLGLLSNQNCSKSHTQSHFSFIRGSCQPGFSHGNWRDLHRSVSILLGDLGSCLWYSLSSLYYFLNNERMCLFLIGQISMSWPSIFSFLSLPFFKLLQRFSDTILVLMMSPHLFIWVSIKPSVCESKVKVITSSCLCL